VTRLEQVIRDHLDRGELREAVTEGIRGYGPEILGYLAGALPDLDSTYEIFSQFSEDLWASLGAFRRECSFRTWAYALAWRAAQRHANNAHQRRVRRLETTEISKIADEVRSSTLPRSREMAARLRRGLDPAEQEVAQVLSQPGEPVDEASLRKRFERVKERLRKMAQGLHSG
jgi:RNA polymerase sigma-70 factor (ECF subfamily)